MSYLVDTNVLSELRRREPEPAVVRWMEARPATALFLSVLTVGELRKDIEALSKGQRKQQLLDWLDVELPAFFANRLLPVDAKVADRWGKLLAQAGHPLPAIDSLLAATALSHGLTLVTRNVRDFQFAGLTIIDPWGAG
ncbi:MAG: type II toxin-antitoxin system VapC family toxin [Betaproteobacteria bacterium]|nr:type II toxin-antitoxin system VapC family toxin [Betaproteobacteria bacterium]MDE2124143.1 type II toxin-antitoxin system VapC family toxin [Betaproteobacteria bacterium]MDE2186350.1 type II toxin-antitoxin system VapC family toxin [Betaproteobacteria bacterium]MDE2325684.1 type II toxin-antitoxin system VapC family toxin [Betaproteobacteria bacterium]